MRPHRRRGPLRLRHVGILVVLGIVGCLATRPITYYGAQPADRVQLAASEAFEVRPVTMATATPSTRCLAWLLEGRVVRVVRDTLILSRVRVFDGPRTGRACKWSGPSFVVRTEVPGLTVRKVRVSALRTSLLVLAALPVLLIVMVLASGFQFDD